MDKNRRKCQCGKVQPTYNEPSETRQSMEFQGSYLLS